VILQIRLFPLYQQPITRVEPLIPAQLVGR
jgi:hypothetical protein